MSSDRRSPPRRGHLTATGTSVYVLSTDTSFGFWSRGGEADITLCRRRDPKRSCRKVQNRNKVPCKINDTSRGASASVWQHPFLLENILAKQAGSSGAPGSGGGGTVDICRGWRAECTGNGVSRRSLVGHYPGVLMKCGAVHKRGSLDGVLNARVGRGGTSFALVLVSSHPMGAGLGAH